MPSSNNRFLSIHSNLSLSLSLSFASTLPQPPTSCITLSSLRQSNPTVYSSVRHALVKLIRSTNPNQWHISHAYRGIVPAALGAIPSSALYFGAYESSKIALSGILLNGNNNNDDSTTKRRLLVHGLAAASGNTISSAILSQKKSSNNNYNNMLPNLELLLLQRNYPQVQSS